MKGGAFIWMAPQGCVHLSRPLPFSACLFRVTLLLSGAMMPCEVIKASFLKIKKWRLRGVMK